MTLLWTDTPLTSNVHPPADAAVNILPTLNLLEAVRAAGSVPHVVFASSGGAVYGFARPWRRPPASLAIRRTFGTTSTSNDVVEAFDRALALRSGFRVYNIGSGEGISVSDLHLIRDLYDSPVPQRMSRRRRMPSTFPRGLFSM